jgi:hypothetical protein
LRLAGRVLEGSSKTYVLDLEHAGYVRPIAYVTPHPTVDLGPLVGKTVEVWGPALYRGDIKTNHITAMRVFAD